MALAESTRRHPAYRSAQAFLGAVVVVAVAWYLWSVIFAGWRPWEGSRPRLQRIEAWTALVGPARWDWDGRVALIKTDGDRLVQIAFWGDACTSTPWRIRADYTSDVIVVDIDPDPRGCRGGNGEVGVRPHAAELTLREPIAGRAVELRCSGSPSCDPTRTWAMGSGVAEADGAA